jgi:hypothetical protein
VSDLTIKLAVGTVGGALITDAGLGQRPLALAAAIENNDFDAAGRNNVVTAVVAGETRDV